MPINRTFTNNLKSQAYVRHDGTASNYDHGGRHELLRTSIVHNALYDYIKDHPDCVRSQACAFVVCNWRRVTDLVNEGLVYESGRDDSNAKTLRVIEGADAGRKRDLVHVEVVISVNEFGEYSCEAKVVGEQPGASQFGRKIQVAHKVIPLRVPRPQEFIKRVITTVKDKPILDLEPENVVLHEVTEDK